jgi:2-haloacid dehalogenase
MPRSPTVVAFDVNETLIDLQPLRRRFEEVGAPGYLFETWFASTLRDGFALTAAGAYADFASVALDVLRGLLSGVGNLQREPVKAAEHVLAGLPELDLHPDVAKGMRRLRDAGVRMVTLTNGAAELTGTLLQRGGVADLVERRLSVTEVGRWKPAPEPYLYAARECGVEIKAMVLVAVHPWDIDGAKRAGLLAGWLNRTGSPYPDFFAKPDAAAPDLRALADALLEFGA